MGSRAGAGALQQCHYRDDGILQWAKRGGEDRRRADSRTMSRRTRARTPPPRAWHSQSSMASMHIDRDGGALLLGYLYKVSPAQRASERLKINYSAVNDVAEAAERLRLMRTRTAHGVGGADKEWKSERKKECSRMINYFSVCQGVSVCLCVCMTEKGTQTDRERGRCGERERERTGRNARAEGGNATTALDAQAQVLLRIAHSIPHAGASRPVSRYELTIES